MIALKKVKIGRKVYFIDSRLNELRNVKNPFDFEKMGASEEFYIKVYGEYKEPEQNKVIYNKENNTLKIEPNNNYAVELVEVTK